ncbi:DEAD/DEAH box helicase [Actinocorallia populi]|uniref:DEAD/DEAH box helicase n=1 Tax=Actinocorallia populi TaxID=2079200 RepID=UPI001E62379B|nr:DEAD/DEAH box helicase [Actinocorallia populi]
MSDVSPALPAPTTEEEILPSFAELGLPAALVDSLARNGITHPFPIQAASIPDALAGRDILGRGKTGSGKTLGFGLPLLTLLAHQQARPKRPLGLILVPTRELAQQVQTVIEPLGRAVGLRMKTVIGQTSMPRQIDALRRGVEILVATPGRLKDLMRQGACDLSEVRIAVLDEADHMADMGFLPDVTDILNEVRPGGQRMLFSATLDREVDVLVNKYLNDPVTHALSEVNDTVDTMEHHLLLVPPKEKNTITAEIANREGRTILFARTKHGVDRIAKQLTSVGVRAAGLHGGKSQNLRTRTLAEFREGRISVLVATDVAARGIHVDDVTLVLHVDPPADHKDYMHRAGRTARAGEKGTVVTMVLSHQVRATTSMMRRAGINAERLKVTSMDPSLVALTGAREPSGVPIPEPIIPEQEKRSSRRQGGFGRGPRRGGGGGGGRPYRGGREGGFEGGRDAGRDAAAGRDGERGGGRPYRERGEREAGGNRAHRGTGRHAGGNPSGGTSGGGERPYRQRRSTTA